MSSFKAVAPDNPYFDQRPAATAVDTIVIHSMYSEHSSDPYKVQECHQALINHNVSAHFYIEQPPGTDSIWASVPTEQRAWHAGKSKMPFSDDNREAVNDFSIGIELIGSSDTEFSPGQYENLTFLIRFLLNKHPIQVVVGHDQIASGRKTDPGAYFDWSFLKKEFANTLRFV